MKLKNTFHYVKDYLQSKLYNFKRKTPLVFNDYETIEYILENKCSIARFGDGELRLMRGIDLEFQAYDKELSNKLKQVTSTDKCLTCIPDIFSDKHFNRDLITAEEFDYWTSFKKKRGGLWNYYFGDMSPLGDAFLSRFYLRKNNKEAVEYYVKKLKMLWDKRNIIFVEGEQSRLGYGNDLFDNALSIKRILCPPSNCYAKYDEIKASVLKHAKSDDLIIMALGPVATALAFELSSNFQCLDLGHVDIEYEWFKLGTTKKVPIKSKYVNEVEDGRKPQDVEDLTYRNQIIDTIK